jgi:3-oxoacyl-[acyl-carrier-protein] synthase-3
VRDVYINAIAAFLPNDPIDNNAIEDVLGMVGSKPSKAKNIVLKSNGIKTRYYAIDRKTKAATHSNVDLTIEAIRGLEKFGFSPQAIELIACGTTMPDQTMPNHALMVHGALKNPPCEAFAAAGICLSGMMALKYAYLAIRSGDKNNAIATGSENASAIMRSEFFEAENDSLAAQISTSPQLQFEKDFLRWMLSDGAGAVWLCANANTDGISLKIEWIEQRSYASEAPICMYAGCDIENGKIKGWREWTQQEWLTKGIFNVKQDAKLLNANIVPFTVQKLLKELLQNGRFKPEEIDYFLPHYSSEYFRDKLWEGMKAVSCNIDQSKWFTNLTAKGNTGSASIYIILEELFNGGKLKRGEKLLCYIPESGRFSSAFMLLSVV